MEEQIFNFFRWKECDFMKNSKNIEMKVIKHRVIHSTKIMCSRQKYIKI